MSRITPHFIDGCSKLTTGTEQMTMICNILASFVGKEGHLHHSCSLMVELIHKLLPVFPFLQCGVESNSPTSPEELKRGPCVARAGAFRQNEIKRIRKTRRKKSLNT